MFRITNKNKKSIEDFFKKSYIYISKNLKGQIK
jgi:UTP-glucose-1-phosphate uridylyltransferase